MPSVIPGIRVEGYRPHALHLGERIWPETNCYTDLWIEVIASLGTAPEAMLGFTLMQDFEGDQATFFKVPLEDLEALYGIRVSELAIFDTVESHIREQIARGRLCLIEMDSFYLPDTAGTAYRNEHGKTTIAINRLDEDGRTLDYFHNAGYFTLSGEDFDGLFRRGAVEGDLPFLPYSEFAKLPAALPEERRLRETARGLLARHYGRRPADNPIAAFAQRLPHQAEALSERPFDFFHKYAFNTLRQFGANFELAGDHLDWICADLAPAASEARRIAETMKTAQFQLARALTRRRFDPLNGALAPAEDAWDRLMAGLGERL